jgi:hypothetical protein
MLVPLIALVALALAYWFGARRWFARWGATDADLRRVMGGDAIIAAPTHVQTQAVTVDAPPDAIWPWLVQIGHRRGGLYSYDWLDRLFGYLDRPSADRILPEFQQLAPGDVIPLGRGQGFPVVTVEPQRALVLGGRQDGFEWVWQFGLYRLDDRRTRLVTRGAQRFAPSITAWLFMRVMEPAAFLMTRRMLLGVKQRAERLHRTRIAGVADGRRPAA